MFELNENQLFSVLLFIFVIIEIVFGFAMNTRGTTNYEANFLYIFLGFLVLATITLAFHFWTKESRLY